MTVAIQRRNLISELRAILLSHEGPETAITAGEMARMFSFKDDRPVRQAIRQLIADGLPVAANTDIRRGPLGYFIPTSPEQAQVYADSVKMRLIEDALRRRDFKRAAEAWFEAKLDLKPVPPGQGRLL